MWPLQPSGKISTTDVTLDALSLSPHFSKDLQRPVVVIRSEVWSFLSLFFGFVFFLLYVFYFMVIWLQDRDQG